MKKLLAFALVATIICGCADKKEPTRIACIGDSITEGYGHKTQSKTSWPVVLNQLLGNDYIVMNCGRSGTTMQKETDYSYWTVSDFANALNLNPNVVVIKLGTNDSKTRNWNFDRFKADYQSLIDTINSLKTKPRIILCKPAPAFDTAWTINDSVIKYGVIPAVEDIASRNKLEIIDLYKELKGDSINFPDGIHPDELCAKKIAHIIYKQIKNGVTLQ